MAQSHPRFHQIGLDRIVRLKWLERTAFLVLAGNDAPTIKTILQEELRGAFQSYNLNTRGSLNKTITILMRTWVRPPRELSWLRQRGLELLSRLPGKEQIVVHWGMVMAVYPFWGAVAAHVGRLLRLQGSISHAQIRRRIMEQYGQRSTVKDAVRRVLRSFIDWGVLKETSRKGIYTSGLTLHIQQAEQIAWLAEAFLHAHSKGSVALRAFLDSISLFPFRLEPLSALQLVAASERLDVLRHSSDQDLLMLSEK